jgi:hypothetical protein
MQRLHACKIKFAGARGDASGALLAHTVRLQGWCNYGGHPLFEEKHRQLQFEAEQEAAKSRQRWQKQ